MLLATISPVADEVDILEVFVRYHCALADRMILLPHRSHPQILQILEALKSEGLPIEILPHDSVELRESELLTTALHDVASRFNPQWILPMAVDEFIIPTKSGGGFESIKEKLIASDTSAVQLLPWRTYIPTETSAEKHVLKRITKRRAIEAPQFTRALVPGNLAEHITVPFGSHHMLMSDGSACREQSNTTLSVAHFPVRSSVQIMNKVLRGWPAHLANPAHKPGESFQWQRLFERCRDKGEILESEVLETAINYISASPVRPEDIELLEDPIDIPAAAQALHYDYIEPTPLQVLADTAERMAKAVADLKRG